jgi:hypothetical protein
MKKIGRKDPTRWRRTKRRRTGKKDPTRRRRKKRKTWLREMGNFGVPMDRTEQGDEEVNCSARLNKRGYSGFNATAVFEEVVPKKENKNNGQITRRS